MHVALPRCIAFRLGLSWSGLWRLFWSRINLLGYGAPLHSKFHTRAEPILMTLADLFYRVSVDQVTALALLQNRSLPDLINLVLVVGVIALNCCDFIQYFGGDGAAELFASCKIKGDGLSISMLPSSTPLRH